MRSQVAWVSLSLSVLVLAGCVGEEPDDGSEGDAVEGVMDHARIAALIGAPIEVQHDHRDPTYPDHNGGVNLALVSWNTLGVTLGENGFANFVFYEDDDEDLVFIAVDGDSRAGFVIADASDPANVTPLGSYFMDGNSVQEVRVTQDGRFAVLNVQDLPTAGSTPGLQQCTVCLHLFDVSDRTAPVWLDALPIDNIGTHNMHVVDWQGATYVFYVGQPASYTFPSNIPGNYVGVAQIVAAGPSAKLVPVGEWRDPTMTMPAGRTFPHDVIVEPHPKTGQLIGYVSHWDGGAVTVDFSNPSAPRTLGVDSTQEPSGALAIHWFHPEPALRNDGRLLAWSAPEIGQLDSDAGAIRVYDVSNPEAVQHLAAWMLPGNVSIPGAYVFSGHTVNVDPETLLAAVGYYHAGVWVLDVADPEDPRHIAYYMPFGDANQTYDGEIWWKKPNFDPDGFGPNVYQARWKEGLLWVSERGTGLYVLQYTGPHLPTMGGGEAHAHHP